MSGRPRPAYADLVAKAMSEDELQENVRTQAAFFQWIHYHTRDSRRSEARIHGLGARAAAAVHLGGAQERI